MSVRLVPKTENNTGAIEYDNTDITVTLTPKSEEDSGAISYNGVNLELLLKAYNESGSIRYWFDTASFFTIEDYNSVLLCNQDNYSQNVPENNLIALDNPNFIKNSEPFKLYVQTVWNEADLYANDKVINISKKTDDKGDYFLIPRITTDEYEIMHSDEMGSIIGHAQQVLLPIPEKITPFPLYRGTNNPLHNKTYDYPTIFEYNNKIVEEIYIDKEHGDTLLLRVRHPYTINSNEEFKYMIPFTVENKVIETTNDLNGFDYGRIGRMDEVTAIIDKGKEFYGSVNSQVLNSDLTVNAELVLTNVLLEDNKLVNNNFIEFKGCTIRNTRNDELFIENNGRLIFNRCTIENIHIFNIDTANIEFRECNIRINDFNELNLPLLYSNNNNVRFVGCNILVEYTGTDLSFNYCLYRANQEIKNILINNTVKYNITGNNHSITGDGYLYCLIDEKKIQNKGLIIGE